MTNNKKYLIIIIVLSLALIASVFLVVRVTSIYNRAATSTSSVVLENSYLFASPIQAKADGQEAIRITVFLLDGRGLGVANQNVSLDLPKTVTIINFQGTTDSTGKAVFDISSSVVQNINITAKSNNLTLPQKVKIAFY